MMSIETPFSDQPRSKSAPPHALDDDDVFDPFQYAPPTSALDELRAIPHWVSWKYFLRPGTTKPTKPPVDPNTGGAGSHSDPKTWAAYEKACWRTRVAGLAGVGFVLTDGDGLTGIDLDACRNAETGELEPWALEIIDLAETYAEVSPSGTGIRLLARGKVASATKSDPAHVEIYGSHRYLTITGNHIDDTPEDIRPAPQTIERLLARVAAHAPKARSEEQGNRPKHQQIVGRHGEERRRENRPKKGGSKSFFRAVNERALANLDLWVTAIFPSAKFQPSTGAFRVTSKSLGRPLQEDIALAPTGIVDFGVADMGDPQQGKRTAIDMAMEWGGAEDATAAAKWLCDKLGVTPEALGWRDEDAAVADLAAQLGRTLVEDEDGTLHDPETGEIFERPAVGGEGFGAASEMPENLTTPSGILGEIVDWIVDSAQRPNRVLALGAAIVTLGTIIGRRVVGPTSSGTHLYIIALASSASGKDHPLRRAIALVNEINPSLVGPGEFTSQPALIRHVGDHPLSLCAMDELGAVVARICHPRAGSWERGLTKALREFWGASFEIIPSTQWATQKTEPIKWPALSLFGVSTHQEFFDAMSSKEATNGFLNRFLMLSTNAKVVDVDEPAANRHDIPSSIKQCLNELYSNCLGDEAQFVIKPEEHVERRFNANNQIPIGWADDAVRKEYRDLVKHALVKAESAIIGEIYGRTAEMAVRLATIHAVSRDRLDAKVTHEDFVWGRDLAMWSTDTMAREASMRMSDTEAQARANLVLRIVNEAGGGIKHRDLNRKLAHRLRPQELKDAISALVDSGAIERRSTQPAKGGTPTIAYFLHGDGEPVGSGRQTVVRKFPDNRSL